MKIRDLLDYADQNTHVVVMNGFTKSVLVEGNLQFMKSSYWCNSEVIKFSPEYRNGQTILLISVDF